MFEVKLIRSYVPLAQLVEHMTFNHVVRSSSLRWYTIYKKKEEKKMLWREDVFGMSLLKRTRENGWACSQKYYFVENR